MDLGNEPVAEFGTLVVDVLDTHDADPPYIVSIGLAGIRVLIETDEESIGAVVVRGFVLLSVPDGIAKRIPDLGLDRALEERHVLALDRPERDSLAARDACARHVSMATP